MPSSTSATNSKGTQIFFEENTHKYFTKNDPKKEIVYTSVTSYVSTFFKPFDAEAVANKIAKSRNTTPEALLKEWADISKEACVYGTRVHECCEDTLRGRSLRCVPQNEKEQKVFINAMDIARKLKQRFDIVGIEKLIFDEELRLAGTIDLLLKSKTAKDTYIICDWKTNKEINTESKYGEHALYPIESLDDCETSHYGLQLGLYSHILKSGGYIPNNSIVKKAIVHITQTGSDIITLDGYDQYVDLILKFKNGNI